jgi:AAA domain
VLAELDDLEHQLAPWRQLGSIANREAQLRRLEAERGLAAATKTQLEQRRAKIEHQLAEADEAVKHFRRLHAAEPRGLVVRVNEQLAQLCQLRERLRETEQRANQLRTVLDADLGTRLARIEALGLRHGSSLDSVEERFAAIAFAHSEARCLATKIDAPQFQTERAAGRRQLGAIDEALGRIDQQLKATRQAVIADAKVIAAPLTHVYLRDELQDRRFDTVILDEASMAPIPALWIAARLAEANLVVVGDSGQLPPIKQSAHPLADKWLGQHILDASRLRATSCHGNPPPHFIQLTADEQTTSKL